MLSIKKCPVPANTMLDSYSTNGAYADCYRTEVPGQVSLAEFIFTFYTTPLFKLERFILKTLVAKPSTDIHVRQLADGTIEHFAAWQVEARSQNELLMCDFHGRTCSWLMAVPINAVSGNRTQLHFGSAIIPERNLKTGTLSLGFGYQALLGFHKVYSVLLLGSAILRMRHHISNSTEKQDQVP